jgi:3-oxoacyl-(acyl-carrier-protein) synthase
MTREVNDLRVQNTLNSVCSSGVNSRSRAKGGIARPSGACLTFRSHRIVINNFF